MDTQKIRPCGLEWKYCNGNCNDCTMRNVVITSSTDYNYANNKTINNYNKS